MASSQCLTVAGLLAIWACSSADGPDDSDSGSLRVTTVTTGSTIDPDGYNLMLDNVLSDPIGVNGSATVPGLPPGDVIVELINVMGNCVVADPRRRTLTIQAGATAQTTFSVNCVPIP